MPYSSLHSLTSPPLGLTVALSVAVVCVTDEAAPVTTVAADADSSARCRCSCRRRRTRSAPRCRLPSDGERVRDRSGMVVSTGVVRTGPVVELPVVPGNPARRGRAGGVEARLRCPRRRAREARRRLGAAERQALKAVVALVAPLLLVPVEVAVDELVVLGAVGRFAERRAEFRCSSKSGTCRRSRLPCRRSRSRRCWVRGR